MGLVTNPTGVLPSTLDHAVDVMVSSAGAVDIRAVFGPEHGFRGIAQAGSSGADVSSSSSAQQQQGKHQQSIERKWQFRSNAADGAVSAPLSSFTDPRTGLPVYDTYRKSGTELTVGGLLSVWGFFLTLNLGTPGCSTIDTMRA